MTGPGHNSDAVRDAAADDRLRLLIERIERLEEEKKGIADDIRDVYAEAKAVGYDPEDHASGRAPAQDEARRPQRNGNAARHLQKRAGAGMTDEPITNARADDPVKEACQRVGALIKAKGYGDMPIGELSDDDLEAIVETALFDNPVAVLNAARRAARTNVAASLSTQNSDAEELTFTEWRKANLSRCERWHPGGLSDWTLNDWMTAVCGEVGELANECKKLKRLQDGVTGNLDGRDEAAIRQAIADEIADVAIYLDILAASEKIDLAAAIVSKFNETSKKVGFPERLSTAAQDERA